MQCAAMLRWHRLLRSMRWPHSCPHEAVLLGLGSLALHGAVRMPPAAAASLAAAVAAKSRLRQHITLLCKSVVKLHGPMPA